MIFFFYIYVMYVGRVHAYAIAIRNTTRVMMVLVILWRDSDSFYYQPSIHTGYTVTHLSKIFLF